MPLLNSGLLGLLRPKSRADYPSSDRYDIYVNDEYVEEYLPQGNELDTWNLEQRLVDAGLLSDFVQTAGKRINIYCSDTKVASSIKRYLRVICAIE